MRICVENKTLIVTVDEEFSYENASMIKKEIMGKISNVIEEVVFDFEHLQFFDSSGIGIIIAMLKKVKENQNGKGKIIILHAKKSIIKMLWLVRLHHMFQIEGMEVFLEGMKDQKKGYQ
ncbi:MAG: STAS domain-containing protein [Bacillota bacterium]